MRAFQIAAVSSALASTAFAQTATLSGEVLVRDTEQPLGYTTVTVLSQATQFLTGETGRFTVTNLAPGEVRLRFKRIGFSPVDTVLTIAANDTAHVTIGLKRLALELPAVVVSGKCTDDLPLANKGSVLAQLFDQVNQNAERFRLLAESKPFHMHIHRVRGFRNRDDKIVAMRVDTVVRGPLPAEPYRPKNVLRRQEGGDWDIGVPELPDFADTAFTNNHCFFYAGQTRVGADSVIQVDFEPVPWLDKETDIKGSMYLRVDTYELVETITKLNKVPAQFRRSGLQEHSVRMRFSEIVNGITVPEDWDLTNRYRAPRSPFVERGQVFNLTWVDTTTAKPQ